jgi:glutathione peroxidase
MPVMTTIYDHPVTTLGGGTADLHHFEDDALLIVNVASKCGSTPQYAGLEQLYETYKDRGFSVLGFPCNQFGNQEPGTAAEIQEFCTTNYGVTFPMFDKVEVNGEQRDPLFTELTATPDVEGEAGDVSWNFEKFLVAPGGQVVARFRPSTQPLSDEVVTAVEKVLPR